MPLLPYLPLIVWMSMIQVALGMTHDRDTQSMDDPNQTTSRESILRFPTQLAVAVVG
jgi:hypothetical protein